MSTKKLQIVTPIVTSVNGQTGDVTLDVSGSGGSMKKLTFTGGATGEYDGSSDVNVAIPEDRFYILNVTSSENGIFTIANDFDEAIAASRSGKIIIDDVGSIISIGDYSWPNPSACSLYVNVGDVYEDIQWEKATGLGTLVGYYKMPSYNLADANTPLAASGAAYWDKDKHKWTIKDISSSANSDIYILNMVSETVDGTDVIKITNDFDEAKAAYDAGKIFGIKGANNAGDILFYVSNFSNTNAIMVVKEGAFIVEFTWSKATGIVTAGEQYEIPLISSTIFNKSGAVYWDKDQREYILKDISSASGGASVQSDWQQNDSTASDYIRNKTGGYDVPVNFDIIWDGDIEGETVVKYSEYTGTDDAGNQVIVTQYYWYCSDLSKYSVEDLNGAKLEMTLTHNGQTEKNELPIYGKILLQDDNSAPSVGLLVAANMYDDFNDDAIEIYYTFQDNVALNDEIILPKKGYYFIIANITSTDGTVTPYMYPSHIYQASAPRMFDLKYMPYIPGENITIDELGNISAKLPYKAGSDITIATDGTIATKWQRSNWMENNSASFSYIYNRPFYVEPVYLNITWDGNIEGKTAVPAGDGAWYLVYEPTSFLSIYGAVGMTTEYIENATEKSLKLTNLERRHLSTTIAGYLNTMIVIAEYNNQSTELYTFPKKGVYFYKSNDGNTYIKSLKGTSNNNIHKINASYLPKAAKRYEAGIVPYGSDFDFYADEEDTMILQLNLGDTLKRDSTTNKIEVNYKAGNGISISDDGTISVTAAKMYSGTSTPADSLGENGDIYVQTEG